MTRSARNRSSLNRLGAIRERSFTPFDRLSAQTTEIEGAGVGLALSRRLMTTLG